MKCMERVRERAEITLKSGEHLVLYSQRIAYATDALRAVDGIALAEMMGHTDVRMTHRYTQFNTARLHEIQEAIQANRRAPGSA